MIIKKREKIIVNIIFIFLLLFILISTSIFVFGNGFKAMLHEIIDKYNDNSGTEIGSPDEGNNASENDGNENDGIKDNGNENNGGENDGIENDGIENDGNENNDSENDGDKPLVISFKITPNILTNKDVVLTIEYSENTVKKQYKKDEGNWEIYKENVMVKNNSVVYAKGTSSSGEESDIVIININNIDKTSPADPIIKENTEESTNQIKIISIDYSNDSKQKQYKIGEGVWQEYSNSLSINNNSVVYAKSIDEAGNESVISSYSVEFAPVEIVEITPEEPIEMLGTFDYITNAGGKAVWDAINIDKVVPPQTNVSILLSTSSDGVQYSSFSSSINNIGRSQYLKIRIVTSSNDLTSRAVVKGINVLYHFEQESINTIKPIAVISLNQDTNIKTNTNLTWGSAESFDTNQIAIINEQWEGKQTSYSVPGQYVVKLRVQNQLGVWSDWVQKTIEVEAIVNHKPTANIVLSPESNLTTDSVISWGYIANDIDNDKIVDVSWINKQSQYSVQGYYKVDLKVKDEKGTWSDWVSKTIYVRNKNLDNPKINISTNNITKNDVVATINYASTTPTKLYSFDGINWINYTAPLVISENKTIYAKGINNQNQVSGVVVLTVTNIDKTIPVTPSIYYSPNTPTGSSGVYVTINYSNDSYLKFYSLDNGISWKNYEGQFNVKNNINVKAKSFDYAGNESEVKQIAITNIRNVPSPTYTINPNIDTSNDVILTIDYKSQPGKKYMYTDGTWLDYKGPITITNNQYIYVKSISDENVSSNIVTININNIDKTGPNEATFSPDITVPTKNNVAINITYPTDAVVLKYKINEGVWQEYKTAISVNENQTIYAKSYDILGNESWISSYVVTNIDKVKPNAPVISASTNEPLVDLVNINVGYSNDSSSKLYKINNGQWNAYSNAIGITSNCVVYAKGIDEAGNESDIVEYTVSNINNVLKPIINVDKAYPVNTDVIVTIDYRNMLNKKYSFDSIVWLDYTGPITITENKTIYARAIGDNDTPSTIETLTITNIDKIKPQSPVISQTSEIATNGFVMVSINYSSDSIDKKYSFDNINWQDYTSDFSVNNNAIIYTKGIDEAGNESIVTSKQINVVLKPIISINDSNMTNKDLIVTINYRNMLNKKYSLDNMVWNDYTGPITITENETIYAKAIENNVESEIQSLNVTNIDKIKPGDPVIIQSTDIETTGDIVININYSADSVIKQYSFDNANWLDYIEPIVISSNRTIYAKGIDSAGNSSNVINKIIDNIVTVLRPSISVNTVAPTNQDVTVTVDYKGVANKKYKIDNGSWLDYTNPIIISSNSTVYAKGINNEGFESLIRSQTINNIDKIAPVKPTFIPSILTPTNSDVEVSITYSDDSINKQYKINDGSWQDYIAPIVLNSNAAIYAKSTDSVGNESEINNVIVSNIDKVIPDSPILTQDITDVTEGSVSVSINYSIDSISKQYKIDDGNWQNYITPIVLNDNATIYAKSIDSANNESNINSLTVTNINHKPVAVITMTPNENITTASLIAWNYTNSTDIDNDAIVEYQWENALENYNTVGEKTIRLRVKDSKGSWSDWVSKNIYVELDWILISETNYIQDATEVVDWLSVTISSSIPTDTRIKYYYSISEDGENWGIESEDISEISNSRYIKARISYQRLSSTSNTPILNSFTINCDREVFTYVPETMPKKPTVQDLYDNANSSDFEVSFAPANKEMYLSEYRVIFVPLEQTNTFNIYEANVLSNDRYQTVNLSETSNIQIREGLKDSNGDNITDNKVYKVYALAIGNSELVKNQLSEGSDNIMATTKPNTPIITTSEIKMTNSDITVTIEYPSNATIKEYKIGEGDIWYSYTDPIVIADNTSIYAKCYNAQGRESDIASLVVNNIDKTLPSDPTISINNSNPTNQTVVTTINFAEDSTDKVYSINGGEWVTSLQSSVQIDITDNCSIEAKNKDEAGNWSMIVSLIISNIDKTLPVEPTITPNITALTNTDVLINIVYSSDSNIKQYSFDNIVWNDYTSDITVSSNGVVYAKARDEAGNWSTISTLTINNIDKTAPLVPTVNLNGYANNTWTTGQVTINVTANVTDTDIANIQYSKNSGAWTNLESGVLNHTEESSGTTYSFRTIDNVGNTSIATSLYTIKLDKTIPIITLNGTSTITLDEGDSFTDPGAVATDNADPSIQSRLAITGTVDTAVVGTYLLQYNVTDSAGNVAAQKTRTVIVQEFIPVSTINGLSVNKPDIKNLDVNKTYYAYWGNTDPYVVNCSLNLTSGEPALGTWYDYSTSKWANIRTYANGMLAYWVWIPRYAYSIPSPHTSTAQTIDVKFMYGTSSTVMANGQNLPAGYTVHPAFKFGSAELKGIWVAKFEASSDDPYSLNVFGLHQGGIDSNVSQVQSFGASYAWKSIKVSNAFDVCRKMESTGGTLNKNVTINADGTDNANNNIDSHLMKNTEWGAIAYLSRSNYGKTSGEIWINPSKDSGPSSDYMPGLTGQVGSSVSSSKTTTTTNYDTGNGPQGSTTGNVYGVYDMSGGSYEMVAAYINNGATNLTTNGLSLLNAASRYKEIYPYTLPDTSASNYPLLSSYYGDAMWETSNGGGAKSWYLDFAVAPYGTLPFFRRGGYLADTTNAGIFYFCYSSGKEQGASFRPVLVISPGI